MTNKPPGAKALKSWKAMLRRVARWPCSLTTARLTPELDCEVVQVRLSDLSLHHPRQWGGCWLALHLWEQLGLDEFWDEKLRPSRKGTRWLNVLKIQNS